ncbi:hypothetical protein [Helicobacter felis]|uniref:hypothetical protein n=1 Tax=Helicobacter felis TaxID=214 RepID=UPI000CEDBEE3|nr:hypothetical protein [Helicobacter felis]
MDTQETSTEPKVVELSAQEEAILQEWEDHIIQQGAEERATCTPGVFYALIENGEVVNIFDGKTLPEYNPAHLNVVEVPEQDTPLVSAIKYNIGSKFVEGRIEPIDLQEAKARHLELINGLFEADIARVQKEYIPLEEVLTFELQYQEALVASTQETPFLEELARMRGEDVMDLAQKIISKRKAYMKQLATLMGYRHRLKNALEKAQDYEQIAQVEYNSPL